MSRSAPEMEAIVSPLRSVRRRLRLIAAGGGAATLLWTLLAAIILAGISDYFTHLPGPMRMAILLVLFGYAAWGLYAWVARPLFSPIPLDVVAARVEKQNPWLQDRLRSSLLFADGEGVGSAALRRRVVEEALSSSGRLEYAKVIDSQPLRRSLLLVIPPVVVGLLLAWMAPALFRIGLDRLIAPFSTVQWPRTVQIQLVDAIPERVPVGHRLELSAKLNRGDRPTRQVVVSWQVGEGQVQRQLMQRGTDGTYSAGVDVRAPADVEAAEMRLWIEAGDDVLGPAIVGVVPRLQVASVQLRAMPPPYTRMAPQSFNMRLQPANVPAGSGLGLELEFNRAVKEARIEAVGSENGAPSVTWERSSDTLYRGTWVAMQSMRFRVRAEDEHGYTNPAAEEYELIVRPDQQPIIQLESPRRSEERTADATVPLVAMVEDDYGIDTVTLEATLYAAGPATTQPAGGGQQLELIGDGAAAVEGAALTPLETDSQRRRARMTYRWKLVTFPSALLKPGDVIEFQLAARDTFEMNGQTHPAAKTPALRITIVSQEQLLQRVYDELRQVATQVGDVRTRQDRLRNDTEQLREDLQGKETPDDADRAVASRISEQQARAASQVRDASAKLDAISSRLKENASPNTQVAEAVEATKGILERAAEESMRPAASEVKTAADPNQQKPRRDEALANAQGAQKRASEQLTEALNALGDVGGINRAIDMVQELLSKQRELTDKTAEFARKNPGMRPEDLTPEQRDELRKMSEEQGALSKATEETLEQLREMSRRQGADDKSAADAMMQAAQSGQQASVPEHQQRASEAVGKNQSSQASSSQSSAESGLQGMLDNLRDAQQRKLEELVRRLANLQQQLQNLVSRQAGHNLDNLTLRNAAEQEAAEALRKMSRRTDASAAAGSSGQLAASQQQTHQNASDLVVQMDELRSAGEAGAHLSRAAGRMERAVVLLKQEKLEEAMAPPQTEALSELELALAEVAKMREEAEQEREEDRQAKLRQAYEALREQQVQVQGATTALAGTMTQPMRRSDAVRLRQIAADQAKLGEEIKPLTEQLGELGSSTFVRTSRTVGTEMTRIAGELGEQKTGPLVQRGQVGIVARLDAIIRALTPPTPEESKYADRPPPGSGDGGSGGQQRRLPPAAELQLIRDLQSLVNEETKFAAEQAPEIADGVGEQQVEVRSAFDQLVTSVLEDVEMPDEAASRELVPEEVSGLDPSADALDDELLLGDPAAGDEGPDIRMAARRMTRSSVRLREDQDAGELTQAVQERILVTLDDLIKQAQQQQQQQSSSQQSQQQAQGDPSAQPNDQQGSDPSAQQQAAQQSQLRPGATPGEATGDIRETAKEWGGISQRDRQAVIESAGEDILEKYRTLTEEYYRALSTKATENR